MPQPLQVFFFYPYADRTFAGRLKKGLAANGLAVSSLSLAADEPAGLTERIRAMDAVLVLVNPHSKLNEAEQGIWRAVLAAAWTSSKLRILPVLLRDAELPPFVRSATGGATQAIRVQDEKDLPETVDAILEALGVGKPTGSVRGVVVLKQGSVRRQPRIEISSAQAGRDLRVERINEIRNFAQQLKH